LNTNATNSTTLLRHRPFASVAFAFVTYFCPRIASVCPRVRVVLDAQRAGEALPPGAVPARDGPAKVALPPTFKEERRRAENKSDTQKKEKRTKLSPPPPGSSSQTHTARAVDHLLILAVRALLALGDAPPAHGRADGVALELERPRGGVVAGLFRARARPPPRARRAPRRKPRRANGGRRASKGARGHDGETEGGRAKLRRLGLSAARRPLAVKKPRQLDRNDKSIGNPRGLISAQRSTDVVHVVYPVVVQPDVDMFFLVIKRIWIYKCVNTIKPKPLLRRSIEFNLGEGQHLPIVHRGKVADDES
jgi:hypothetical protein